ncbi:MAG: hypothetical protein QM802_06635 [Agriterribacter sp.]
MKIVLFFMLMNISNMGVKPDLKGKTFEAEVQATCKTMSDGGCMIYTYCVLKFEEDKVTVSHPVKAVCTPKEREANYAHLDNNETKQYKWFVNSKQEITIEGFADYGNLIWKNNKLIGNTEKNGKPTAIEFSEQSVNKKSS